MPSASVMAKPKIRLPNWPCAADGLRTAAARYWPKMMPTPTPAPPMPMQAMPAPMYLAITGSMKNSSRLDRSVTGMDGVVQVNAGQDREDIGLQESNQEFERGERDHQRQRQYGADDAADTEGAEHDDEAGENLQRDVTGQHVGEEAHAVRDRPRQEGQH